MRSEAGVDTGIHLLRPTLPAAPSHAFGTFVMGISTYIFHICRYDDESSADISTERPCIPYVFIYKPSASDPNVNAEAFRAGELYPDVLCSGELPHH
ncbi:hypothetical protein JTE90_014148 [Oedothorax gibbosus]|uniref:Uncharacterized protein n=1 Tax=Oedothorax gibbosus TaxID=931172 RepID=A0AAV6VIH3_9ARAC|nr:hypothetical protein JTE90_014148 [Oedothorax gibbosus]